MGSRHPNSARHSSLWAVLIPRREKDSHGITSQDGGDAAIAYGSEGGGQFLLFEWGDDGGLFDAPPRAANEIGLASRPIGARITGMYRWRTGCDEYRRSSFPALRQQDDHDHCCDL
jgi:hypothetical protein